MVPNPHKYTNKCFVRLLRKVAHTLSCKGWGQRVSPRCRWFQRFESHQMKKTNIGSTELESRRADKAVL